MNCNCRWQYLTSSVSKIILKGFNCLLTEYETSVIIHAVLTGRKLCYLICQITDQEILEGFQDGRTRKLGFVYKMPYTSHFSRR